ncbi:MAG: hypothetical protein CMF46_03170 [Legionellales bacterium]|nr:hypothetical protein [Legionellales bacterium]|tara:strand:- start:92 stop:754 length:663 start_codon:yes stop_codon:yes gene_type:complete
MEQSTTPIVIITALPIRVRSKLFSILVFLQHHRTACSALILLTLPAINVILSAVSYPITNALVHETYLHLNTKNIATYLYSSAIGSTLISCLLLPVILIRYDSISSTIRHSIIIQRTVTLDEGIPLTDRNPINHSQLIRTAIFFALFCLPLPTGIILLALTSNQHDTQKEISTALIMSTINTALLSSSLCLNNHCYKQYRNQQLHDGDLVEIEINTPTQL